MSRERTEEEVGGVIYVFIDGKRAYAKCCGSAECTSECKAVIHHGPGHQSRTHCHVKGEHEVHEAIFGRYREYAEWRGEEVFSGFFDEAPELDEEYPSGTSETITTIERECK